MSLSDAVTLKDLRVVINEAVSVNLLVEHANVSIIEGELTMVDSHGIRVGVLVESDFMFAKHLLAKFPLHS